MSMYKQSYSIINNNIKINNNHRFQLMCEVIKCDAMRMVDHFWTAIAIGIVTSIMMAALFFTIGWRCSSRGVILKLIFCIEF